MRCSLLKTKAPPLKTVAGFGLYFRFLNSEHHSEQTRKQFWTFDDNHLHNSHLSQSQKEYSERDKRGGNKKEYELRRKDDKADKRGKKRYRRQYAYRVWAVSSSSVAHTFHLACRIPVALYSKKQKRLQYFEKSTCLLKRIVL